MGFKNNISFYRLILCYIKNGTYIIVYNHSWHIIKAQNRSLKVKNTFGFGLFLITYTGYIYIFYKFLMYDVKSSEL